MAFVDRQRKAREANRSEGYDPSGRNVQRIREARANYKLNRPPRWDEKIGRDVGTMTKDVGTLVASPFKTAWMHGADLLSSGIGAFSQAEKARVGGKFNAPLNIQPRTYKWLSDNVIKDEYEDEFERDVADNSLYWTGLNKYAKDKYIGGGQLAKGINARNEGIIGTDTGSKVLNEVLQEKKGDTPAIRNTIANYKDKILRDLDEGYRRNAYVSSLPEAVTIEDDIPTFEEQLDYDELSGEFFPREAYEQSGVFGRGTAPMSPEESELLMAAYTDPYHGDPYYRPPIIEDIADSASRAENIAALDRIMAQDEYPMVNPIREPMGPMGESWTGQTYGPVGLDAYWDREDEEERRARLWGPWRYPELSPAGQ